MKKWISVLLSMIMVLSLAACGNSGDSSADSSAESGSNAESGSGESTGDGEKIVVWTLANDLKQFAERYTEETGREVEVVVFDSADYSTKIMQTLGTKSTDVDIFVGEPQMLPNFFEAGFCADLSELEEEVSTQLVDYTYEAGKDEDGVLRAVSYQATPGSVIYRCDLAEEVFGTDDPEEIGKKFSSFDTIVETAAELHDKGYTIFGDTGALRWFSNSTSPWVKDGEIIVDQDRLDYFDAAVELYQKEYVAFAPEWSAAWYASMAGPLPMNAGWDALEDVDASNPETQVFSYVMPSWGALIVRDNAADNKGKFGVCSGVCSFFGGGTFLTVSEYSEHRDAAVDFIRYCTLNDDTAQWWLEASDGDVVSSKAVLESNKDYQNPSFNNQHTYEFYAAELEKVDYSLITGYDDTCKEAFGAAIVSVQEGKQSKEDALKEFYTVVTTQYPELSIPDDAPVK
ncbi:MAG: extracellular solute-binding protein [Lachnospiraceae bacterium]|nr:extracellular solute-binding protein [Lachnospiraceae bacterium]